MVVYNSRLRWYWLVLSLSAASAIGEVGTRLRAVELDQHVALTDLLAFGEPHHLDDVGDLGGDVDGLVRFRGAERLDLEREPFDAGRRRHDSDSRSGRRGRGVRAGRGRRNRAGAVDRRGAPGALVRRVPAKADQQGTCEGAEQHLLDRVAHGCRNNGAGARGRPAIIPLFGRVHEAACARPARQAGRSRRRTPRDSGSRLRIRPFGDAFEQRASSGSARPVSGSIARMTEPFGAFSATFERGRERAARRDAAEDAFVARERARMRRSPRRR